MSQNGLTGKTLGGRYQVQELLGKGGMSSVYKAHDPNLQRAVAVKIVHDHLTDDPKFVSRFEAEATAVAQLRHPNIVQVYDYAHDGPMYYMVQEFVPGETLQDRLRRLNKSNAVMPIPEVLQIALDVCAAAEYAHQRGMIHRDIKPANIMLHVYGQAILMDFGIVKIAGSVQHTITGAVVGTALYMPPEVIRGEVADVRSDLYSLGVTMYEMVSGRPPFEADSAMVLMMMHLRDPVPDLRSLRVDVPEPLRAIIEKLLAKDRDRRYSSMAELAADVQNLLDHLRTGAPLSLRATEPGLRPPAALPPHDAATIASSMEAPNPTIMEPLPPDRPARDTPPPGATMHVAGPGAPVTPPPRPVDQSAPGFSVGPSGVQMSAGGGHLSVGPEAVVAVPGAPAGRPERSRRALWIGGAVLLVVLLLGAAVLALRGILGEEEPGSEPAAYSSTGEPTAATSAATDAPLVVGATPGPTDVIEAAPTGAMSHGAMPTPAATPTPEIVASITGITIGEDQRYVVDFETIGISPPYTTTHLHFFWNTVPFEKAGRPEDGLWVRHTGPSPFIGYRTTDRPENASQLCVQAANPDHTPWLGTGACVVLPDVVAVTANEDTLCLFGPGTEYPAIGQLQTGRSTLVHGLSADELWWNVASPQDPDSACWLPIRPTQVSGNISLLPLVDGPPPDAVPDRPFVELSQIAVDEQNRYLVDFRAQGFFPTYPGGTHLHFFFNTVSQEDVGIGGEANRRSHGGGPPFTGYTTADRPAEATELCAVVANPDHTVILDSGTCVPLPDVPIAKIMGITIDEQGRYVVDFHSQGFVPLYPGGTHLHFFFDTFSEADVGIGGEANRRSHGGGPPFTGYTTADRPAGAGQLCVVVARPEHTVISGSGNCYPLLDATSSP